MKRRPCRCTCRACTLRSLIAGLQRIERGQVKTGHEILSLLAVDLVVAPTEQPCVRGRVVTVALLLGCAP
jgi:hypothetical protein